MTEKEKMLLGMMYCPVDKQLKEEMRQSRVLTRLYNRTTEEEMEYREEILRKLLGSAGKAPYIEPPFHCDYGRNIYVGDYFYANYDLIVLDVCDVRIGDNVMFGPRVGIYAAGHPLDADVRNFGIEFGKPVTIGNNVWVGGNVVLNPGVTIGDNVIIGSGSVVTKDIPANTIAVGNPCKVLRELTEEDARYWNRQKELYLSQKKEEANGHED